MRIIGGEYRGRRLKTPASVTRPTSGQLREALFNILGDVTDFAVLDLFAGTGAVGLEALSRGADHVTFVEQSRAALHILRENIALLSAHNRTTLSGKDVLKALETDDHSYDLIFADPPYGKFLGQRTLDLIDGSNLLTSSGHLFIEEGSKAEHLKAQTLTLHATRQYGDSLLYHYGK